MIEWLDTHYHFDFIQAPDQRHEFCGELSKEALGIVAQTVTPSGYIALMHELEDSNMEAKNVIPSLGFHPWWYAQVDSIEAELSHFEQSLKNTRMIGEIGLDFSAKRIKIMNPSQQKSIFQSLIQKICHHGIKYSTQFNLSIHAVKSVTEVLDILDTYDLNRQILIPILHRFNGTSDELTRHIRNGGYISVHPQMFQSKKGRAYLKQIPAERLLLETDLPKSANEEMLTQHFISELKHTLTTTIDQLNDLRQEDLKIQMAINQQFLYQVNDSLR